MPYTDVKMTPDSRLEVPLDSGSTENRLRAENFILQKKAAESVFLRQEVLALYHRLDQDSRRFERMQEFIRLGMLAESRQDLAKQICESTIDLLECGVGMLWCLQCDQDQACLFECGLAGVSEDQWMELKSWVEEWVKSQMKQASIGGEDSAALALPQGLGLHPNFLVELALDSTGSPLSVIFACNTSHQMAFHEGFQNSDSKVFATYSRQVGVLMESFKRRSMIEHQIEQIRASEERLSMALVGSNVGLWDLDLKNRKAFYSEEWKQQIGHTGDEIGDSIEESIARIHPDDLEMVRAGMAQVSRIGGRVKMTFRMRHRNGKWRWIHSVGYNMTCQNGESLRAVGIHIDVTEHKLMETKLLKAAKIQSLAREQAERENQAKSSFLATVSHEIRTPLNGIMAAFQMLKFAGNQNELQHLVEIGERSGKWMLKIIGESLDISRIEAGKVDLVPGVHNLKELLDEMRFLEQRKASEKQIELIWDISPDLPEWVSLDAGRFQQIFNNLIGNAIKFTSKGTVTFRAGLLQDNGEGRLSVRFSVEDTGIGFSKEFRRVMFQPFSQAVKRSEASHHGIGLGLGITKELVRLMGGKIKVASRVGVGSRFDVILPLEREASGNDRSGEFTMPEVRFQGRILLAEDDAVSAELGKMMMEHVGLHVDLAGNGGDALEKARSQPYDLVFMDCWMPVKSGIEVTRELRLSEHASSRFVPIVALTANARTSDVEECHQAGMDGFITKPLLFEQLVETLQRFLGQSQIETATLLNSA